MELTNTTFPVEWKVTANFPYDAVNHTFTEPLAPGKSIPGLSMSLVFHMSEEAYTRSIAYNGGLLLSNADNGTMLTYIPIIIGHVTSLGGDLSCCQ